MQDIKVSGLSIQKLVTAGVIKFGLMVLSMKAIGSKTKLMAEVG